MVARNNLNNPPAEDPKKQECLDLRRKSWETITPYLERLEELGHGAVPKDEDDFRLMMMACCVVSSDIRMRRMNFIADEMAKK